MRRALSLAKKGEGEVSPNPLVGAVIVKKGKIIGSGWHKRAGGAHAEIEAIRDCKRKGNSPRGAAMYVNLEPCARRFKGKKTPPCCDAIVESGISGVFTGCKDPNPEAGNAAAILEKNGISVRKSILKTQCEKINEAFFKNMKTGLPFVILKLSASIDGKIATRTGNSKWIGNPSQRKMAHSLRKQCDAVLVGVDTVEKDNPRLDVRLVKTSRQPACVVADSGLRISAKAKLLGRENVIIAAKSGADGKKADALESLGAEVLRVRKNTGGGIVLKDLMKKLYSRGIRSVLIEGGGKMAASAIREKIADKMVFFYSPLIIGGDGTDMVAALKTDTVKKAVKLTFEKTPEIDGTIIVEAYPEF